MNHLIPGLRRRARLVAAVFLALIAGAAVIVAVPGAASSASSSNSTFRPCRYYWLRPCPAVTTTTTTTTTPPNPFPTYIETRDSNAFVNLQPGATPTLVVTVNLWVGSSGYGVQLVPLDPQGINGDILLLNLVVTPPPPGYLYPQVVVEREARFESTVFTGVSRVDVLNLGLQIPVTVVR